jgi:hypothetical protein
MEGIKWTTKDVCVIKGRKGATEEQKLGETSRKQIAGW